ncbi:tyrosine-type recombinase/integrase [Georgenia yuyongxinii]|uniref:tyrosine-type recombinase/integrase n=1 Tax=Georgenia yuyongxinii TaxID=2589797 RepID=UPI001CB6DE53
MRGEARSRHPWCEGRAPAKAAEAAGRGERNSGRRGRDWPRATSLRSAASNRQRRQITDRQSLTRRPRPRSRRRARLREGRRCSDPRRVAWWWLALKAALHGVGIHTLRHPAASTMLEAGVPLRTVSEILDPASVQVTGNLYGHVSTEGADPPSIVSPRRWGGSRRAPESTELKRASYL